MRFPKLLQFILLVLAAYGIFKAPGWIAGLPIPGSLITIYMFFAVVTILLVMTSTEDSTRELFAPIRALVEDPSKKVIRNIVFTSLPVLAAFITYTQVSVGVEAPLELRATHPAPPSSMNAWGKRYDLMTLENPFRKSAAQDPEGFKAMAAEGGEIYFKNCFYCHGDKLDGKGHYARAINPNPLPFQGKDTIAQLQESYVFWRIAKGGPGLPKEGGPGLSAMPAWEGVLSEDEVWKVILFLYDYTGNVPRSWGK